MSYGASYSLADGRVWSVCKSDPLPDPQAGEGMAVLTLAQYMEVRTRALAGVTFFVVSVDGDATIIEEF
jgi:hypothetical protein